MSFQKVQDVTNKKTARRINAFHGMHEGYSWCDQPDAYAIVTDFDVSRDSCMTSRQGRRKNQWRGYPKTIDNLLSIRLGGNSLMGQICNGVLTVYPISDVLAGLRKYYLVSEVGQLTVQELLDGKTVNDLIGRGGTVE